VFSGIFTVHRNRIPDEKFMPSSLTDINDELSPSKKGKFSVEKKTHILLYCHHAGKTHSKIPNEKKITDKLITGETQNEIFRIIILSPKKVVRNI
jgi:hypothetical protein